MAFRTKIFARFIAFHIVILLLISCQSAPNYVPVNSRSQPPGIKLNYHIVRPSETLFSIAWLYGMDFRELARTNSIGAPYIIRPNQKLSLRLKKTTISSSEYASKVVRPEDIRKTPTQRFDSKKIVAKPKPKKSKTAVKGRVNWAWPNDGPIVRKFSLKRNVNKGIDIGGDLGEPVLSAGDGTVVYAGSGLLGYGNLIIIKHSQNFLSAYGHNSRLLVAEGTKVKVREVIAEIGSSGTDKNKLHFEVRRDGKPVNPLAYLPQR